MISQLEFFATETFISLRRHPAMAFAASICVASALFVAGFVGLALLNTGFAVNTALNRVRFNVYFSPESNRQEAWSAYKRITKLDGVASATFIPKEKSPFWLEMRKEHPELVRDLGHNPLPDCVVIKATDVSMIPSLDEELKGWSEIHEVQVPKEVTGNLESMRAAVNRIGLIVGIVLAALSLTIIHHTIELTLYARRKEIHIMSLVGATPITVATPFLLEGILYGLMGGGVAIGGLYLLYRMLIDYVNTLYKIQLYYDQTIFTHGMVAMLVAGAGLGLFGSLASILKYLHRPRSKMTNA